MVSREMPSSCLSNAGHLRACSSVQGIAVLLFVRVLKQVVPDAGGANQRWRPGVQGLRGAHGTGSFLLHLRVTGGGFDSQTAAPRPAAEARDHGTRSPAVGGSGAR